MAKDNVLLNQTEIDETLDISRLTHNASADRRYINPKEKHGKGKQSAIAYVLGPALSMLIFVQRSQTVRFETMTEIRPKRITTI